MERVHETGCDRQHKPRQRCSLPQEADLAERTRHGASSPLTAVQRRSHLSLRRLRLATIAEAFPGVGALVVISSVYPIPRIGSVPFETISSPPVDSMLMFLAYAGGVAMVFVLFGGGLGWLFAYRLLPATISFGTRLGLIVVLVVASSYAFDDVSRAHPCGVPESPQGVRNYRACQQLGRVVFFGSLGALVLIPMSSAAMLSWAEGRRRERVEALSSA